MQKSEKPMTLEEKWNSLTLANNFIFYKVMRHHPEACQHLIEMLLGIKIDHMEMANEETIIIDHDSKGVRLDVFVKDTGKMYNIEVQVADTKELPERSRYYQGMMDLDSMEQGNQYKQMKDSHVIFICMKDIFDKKLPIYTFENICLEDGTIKLKDRAYKHFFIASTCAKMGEDEEIKAFFNFLISNKSATSFTDNLKDFVEDARHNMQWRMQYMTWERQRAYDLEAGYEKGAKETALATAKNLLQMNLGSPEQIAQAVSLPLEQVIELKEELTSMQKA